MFLGFYHYFACSERDILHFIEVVCLTQWALIIDTEYESWWFRVVNDAY